MLFPQTLNMSGFGGFSNEWLLQIIANLFFCFFFQLFSATGKVLLLAVLYT